SHARHWTGESPPRSQTLFGNASPGNSVSRTNPSRARVRSARETEFPSWRSQTEFGNEGPERGAGNGGRRLSRILRTTCLTLLLGGLNIAISLVPAKGMIFLPCVRP